MLSFDDLKFNNKKMFKQIDKEFVCAKYQNITFTIMKSNGYIDIIALEKNLNLKSKTNNHNLHSWIVNGATINLLQKYAEKYHIECDKVMIYRKNGSGYFLFCPPTLVYNYVEVMISKYLEVIIHIIKQYNGYRYVNLDN